jgi:hypothetical protein
MSDLSPIDASMLALIAENRTSPAQVRRLLHHTGPGVRRIAEGILAPRARINKSDRKTANAIRHWATTNKA